AFKSVSVWFSGRGMVFSGQSHFFMITPQPEENKKYRFIVSLCKNDMDNVQPTGALCPPLTSAISRFFTP
ncbi:hypothetical protein, partial [Enterobacter huaxiensis]|uniref:hypothetical protein n=1 Tax=Enterobacter huaxiensis TaxID=2494702 RepID=UPI0028BD31D8